MPTCCRRQGTTNGHVLQPLQQWPPPPLPHSPAATLTGELTQPSEGLNCFARRTSVLCELVQSRLSERTCMPGISWCGRPYFMRACVHLCTEHDRSFLNEHLHMVRCPSAFTPAHFELVSLNLSLAVLSPPCISGGERDTHTSARHPSLPQGRATSPAHSCPRGGRQP